uniref:Nuclear receptor domain-containing protein n=1 Tax=Rhabditophanes sp. KR3021 TaxID=114890 RepID=A0AC35THK5_9BILA
MNFKNNSNNSNGKQLGECSVCHAPDSASYHFKGLVCPSCNSFFRRTVSLKCNYQCAHDKKCQIYYSLRMLCKSCRFQKCLNANMDASCVQKPRGKYSNSNKNATDPNKSSVSPSLDGSERSKKNIYDALRINSISSVESNFSDVLDNISFQIKKKLTCEEFLNTFVNMEIMSEKRKKIIQGANPLSALTHSGLNYEIDKSVELRGFTFQGFNSVVRCITLLTFDYVISMPYYDEFSDADKFAIFRYTFFVFCILDSSFLTMKTKYHERGLFVCFDGACTSVYDDSYGWESEGVTKKEDKIKLMQPMITGWFDKIVIPMAELDMKTWEFAAFKSLAIWDLCKSELSAEGKKLAREFQSALITGLSKQYKTEDDKASRIGKMILNLTGLHEVTKITVETYFHLDVFNLVEVDVVIKQLLFGQIMTEENKEENK